MTRRLLARALAELDEPSVKEMLSDPIVHAVMRADSVHANELEALLCSVANRLREESRSQLERITAMNDRMNLRNKVALVTGAGSGIGREIAQTFAHAGAHVVIADRNTASASAAADDLNRVGRTAMGITMDVTSESQVEAGVAAAVNAFGRLDILVSNAGIQIVGPIDEFAFVDWKRLLAIHLDGAFLTTRSVLRQMYKQGGGSIIYMGSVHSKEGSVLKAPYVTAKHGLIGLAKVVSKEGAKHGVRANVICPGFVRTPLVDKQIPEQAKKLGISEEAVVKDIMLKDTVDGEFTTAQDVARAALFFASFETNALTGQSLIVSHGWSMQ